MAHSKLNVFRRISLTLAETLDAYRIVPRMILFAYGWMVWLVARWYMSIPSVNQTQCQSDVLKTLLEQNVTLIEASRIACSIVDTIGGPTDQQTLFVSIVTGLSSVVIGLYLNTGKSTKWQSGVIDSIQPVVPTNVDQPQYGTSKPRRRKTATTTLNPRDMEFSTREGDEYPLAEDDNRPFQIESDKVDPDPSDQG